MSYITSDLWLHKTQSTGQLCYPNLELVHYISKKHIIIYTHTHIYTKIM